VARFGHLVVLAERGGPRAACFYDHEITTLRAALEDVWVEYLTISVSPVPTGLCGLACLAFAFLTTLDEDVFPFVGLMNRLALIIACAFFVGYGSLFYIYCKALLLALRLSRARVKGGIFGWSIDAIHKVHAIYLRFLAVGGTVYLLSVAVVLLTPWAKTLADLNRSWVRLWVVPPGFMAIAFFAVFSMATHKLLVQCRARTEQELNKQLQLAYDAWRADHNSAAQGSISALLEWREKLRLARVWLIDYKAVAATVVTLLLPTIEALVKAFGSASHVTPH
jgi:hypothetical protein